GGALPRMPGISNEWEQFRHAWRKNATLFSFEPYTLYRHDVLKAVEPGVQWQPSGVAANVKRGWDKDPAIGGRLAERARDIALAKFQGVKEKQSSLPAEFLPRELHSLYITVYCDGKVRGCAGSAIQNLDGDLRTLVESALHDHRFAGNASPDPEDVAITASLLFNALELGKLTPEEVCPRFELGKQALGVHQGERQGMLLPFLAATHNLDREGFVAEVIDKAGITRPPYRWDRFDCTTWLADDHGTNPLECGFRSAPAEFHFENELPQLADWHASYIWRNVRLDGSLYFSYAPFQNWIYPGGGTPRSAHASWVLMRAADLLKCDDLRKGAEKLLEFHLKLLRKHKQELWIEAADDEPTVSELSFTLLALCERCKGGKERKLAQAIASLLWSRIDGDGRIATHRNAEAGSDEFQDYFPGQLLLALAGAVSAGISTVDGEKLRRALRFYRHRYRYKRNFGQVSWLMQAARGWHEVTGDREWADLAFEIGDWIRRFQLEKNGGFITDHQADGPGYTTALYLEGLAAGVKLARQCGDNQREQAYLESCRNGLRFLKNLVYRPEHDTVLPNPAYALGGVRASLTSSAIRTDFVQHSLAGVLDLCSYLGMGRELPAGKNRARFHTTTNGFKPGGR
ncbi:MAG TPA: AMMECR1 domain-containing protein, partial [Candidatus Angelobacter sp.]